MQNPNSIESRIEQRHPVFNTLKAVFRLFKARPKIIRLDCESSTPTIYLANHAAANGPFTYGPYFPHRFVPWGTYEMCGKIRERWNYLYHVFYRQKLGFPKWKAFLIATPFCVISKMLYTGAELIPTYRDIRFSATIKKSIHAMESGSSVLIFPENSEDVGYQETMDKFHCGFVLLARRFRKKTGIDAPICPVYYNGKTNRMVIGKAVTLRELIEQGYDTDDRVAGFFRDSLNRLNAEYASV